MIFFRFAAENHPSVCVADSSPRGELSPQVTEGWFHIQNPKQLPGSGIRTRRRVSEANQAAGSALRPEMVAPAVL